MRKRIIGKNIKKYRQLKGYTTKQFAEMIGKAYITIRTYESGGVAPSPYTLSIIARILEVSIEDLLRE